MKTLRFCQVFLYIAALARSKMLDGCSRLGPPTYSSLHPFFVELLGYTQNHPLDEEAQREVVTSAQAVQSWPWSSCLWEAQLSVSSACLCQKATGVCLHVSSLNLVWL